MIDEISQAAIDAGRILLAEAEKGISVSHKSDHELVTSADLKSEQFLRNRLASVLPNAGFLGEESWDGAFPPQPFWVVDPLDGTNNYAHGYPVFAVSIALWDEGDVICGCIYDPSRNELFSAEKGKGASLNTEKIRATDESNLARCILATGFPYHRRQDDLGVDLGVLRRFLGIVQGIRRGGSAALDLAYVACGRLDGFWEEHLEPWDMAAGALIVRESGGSISAYSRDSWSIESRGIVASGGPIHQEILRGIHGK